MTPLYELTNFKNIRKGDTLIRFVAGQPAPIGQVVVIQTLRDGAINLVTSEGHRLIGQPFNPIMRGKDGVK